jgi:lysophospholipase L1-like esterase
MKRRGSRALALAAAAITVSAAAPAVAQADPYIAIGDSYTGGFGQTVFAHYRATLGADEFLSKAQGGATSGSAVSSQLPAAVADINAASDTKAVTVFIGGADALGSCAATREPPGCSLRANMNQIFDTLQAALASDPGDEALTAGVYPNPREGQGNLEEADLDQRLLGSNGFNLADTGDPELGTNEIIHQEAVQNGIPVVDPFDEFVACGLPCTSGDNIHPSPQGYAIIANLFCGGACQTSAGGGGGGTSAPETIVTKQPKSKVDKKKVRIEFASSPAGATFECDTGDGFEPCTSPLKVKSKKGRNTVQVRARDAAGNVDGSPSVVSWKYKKKKKRGK